MDPSESKSMEESGALFDTILRGELDYIEEYKNADFSPYLPLLARLLFAQERCQVSEFSVRSHIISSTTYSTHLNLLYAGWNF